MGVDREFKKLLIDRLEGWELVDFLQISIEDVIDAFEDVIEENMEDVKEFAGIKGLNVGQDNEDYE